MNMEIQYYNKIRWGLAPLAPNDAPPLIFTKINKVNNSTYLENILIILL
jgi:hypothetical protein